MTIKTEIGITGDVSGLKRATEEVGKSAVRTGEQASRSFKQANRDAKDYANTLREIHRLQQQTGGGSGGGLPPSTGMPSAPGIPAGPSGTRRSGMERYFASGRGAGMAGALGGLASGMLSGGDGGMWSMAGRAGGSVAGAAAGVMTGKPMIGGGVGAFAGQLLVGIGSAIDKHISNVLREGETYTDLRHSLGATSVEFDSLRDSLRHFADGLDITYGEMGNLAKQFAHTAGLTDASGIGKDVSGAVGFGRGYGISPEQSAQFFAMMRHNGVTTNSEDGRRLAMMIADSVAKGGTSAKMDEVLSAISSFASSQARATLTSPNIGNYVDLMSGMTGLGIPGLKSPGEAASVISAADAAARRGGGFGDPSRSMKLGIYQKFGLASVDMDMMNEQGATGTLRDMLDSSIHQARVYAERPGGSDAELKRLLGIKGNISDEELDKTDIARRMEHAFASSNGDFHKFRMQISADNSLSQPQAMALWESMGKDNGKSLFATLKAAGVDPAAVNQKNFHGLAALAVGDDAMLRTQAERLKKMNLGKDAGALDEALGKGGDGLRNVVLRLTNTYDKQLDQGELARKQQADMEKNLDKLATELVPATLAIKGGILALVEQMAPNTHIGKQIKEKRKEESKLLDIVDFMSADGNVSSELRAKINGRMGSRTGNAPREQVQGELDKIKARALSGEQFDDPRLQAYADKVRAEAKAAGEEVAPIQAPAGGNLDEHGRKAPRNERNHNPGNIEYGEFAKAHGATGSDGRFAIFPDKETGSAAMDTLLGVYSKKHGKNTVAGIIGRWAPSSENNTSSYVKAVASKMGVDPNQQLDMDDPKVISAIASQISAHEGAASAYSMRDKLPAGASRSQPQQSGKLSMSGEFFLRDANGFSLADPIIITRNMAPQPAGR